MGRAATDFLYTHINKKEFMMKGKKTALLLILIVITAGSVYAQFTGFAQQAGRAQQYDSESDFQVERKGDGIVIIKYIGSKTEVRIPSRIQNLPVTGIGENAFRECESLINVTIPDSVTSIGYRAFEYCFNLTSVTIGKGVTSIGIRAFTHCQSLISVTIPDSVTSIGDDAFAGCFNLASVTIPNSVTSIGTYAFAVCDSLVSITIGNSVTNIGDCAFERCANLVEIKVAADNSVYAAENGVLYNKNRTSLIMYPEGKNAASFTIPNGVTIIGNYAFAYCTSLISVTIPDSVTSIGNYAFNYCTKLTGVTIGNSVTSIGEHAFFSCTNLTSIILPDSVKRIRNGAFAECTNLVGVTFQGTIPSDEFFNAGYEPSFYGNLRARFYATNKTNGTPGTYTTTAPVGYSSVWIKK